MPNVVTKITKYMSLCSRHFPDCKEFWRIGKAVVPLEPPTFFPDVPPSSVGTPQPPKRKTVKITVTAASQRPDPDHELQRFKDTDALKLSSFAQNIKQKLKVLPGHILWLNSTEFCFLSHARAGPILNVSIYFKIITSDSDLEKYKCVQYEAFVGLKQVKHPACCHLLVRFWRES